MFTINGERLTFALNNDQDKHFGISASTEDEKHWELQSIDENSAKLFTNGEYPLAALKAIVLSRLIFWPAGCHLVKLLQGRRCSIFYSLLPITITPAYVNIINIMATVGINIGINHPLQYSFLFLTPKIHRRPGKHKKRPIQNPRQQSLKLC
jgi:hypothetical protein